MAEDRIDSVDNLIDHFTARRINRREFFKRAAALGIGVSAAGTLLAACTGDDEAGSGDDGKPVKGGQLIEGYDRDFAKMDPVLTSWDDPSFVALYEFPVIRDADGLYLPAFFDSWTVSEDLLTWTFKMREGLTFHSGAAVDAQVVADNFNAFRDLDGKLGGPGQNAIFWPSVKDVKASDATTVVATMSSPFAAFPETLATENSMITNLVFRKEKGEDYGSAAADGTGPFQYSTYKPGTEVVVTRWDDYPGNNIPYVVNKGAAHLDSVKWVPILEAGQRANEIEAGTAHVVKNPAGQDIERLKGNKDLTTISYPGLSGYYLGLNNQQTKYGFDDVKVRQAISHAIDRQSLVDALFFGQAVPDYGPIASNYKWYEPEVEQFNQFDLEKAKALLDEAGWTAGSDGIREKGGQKLSFTALSSKLYQPTTGGIDEAIVPMLAEIGVEMKLDPPDEADFFAKVGEAGTPEKALNVAAYSFEWLWSSPVDVLVFFQAFPSAAFTGDHVAAAVKKWQTAGDEATLEEGAREMQLAWAEQLPKIPILTRNDTWVHKNEVKGYTPLQSMLYPLYNDVWLAT
ncbi:MAG: ABC transporter substrate-binding protein [Gaiella sp.]